MKFHDGTWDFFKLFIILLSIAGFLFWIRYDFGANIALIVVALCFGTLFFVFGSLFTSYNSQKLLDLLSKFNAKDAMIDRYRAQSVNEAIKANSFRVKTDAQKELIDYKYQQKLLSQQPKELPEEFWKDDETIDLKDWS